MKYNDYETLTFNDVSRQEDNPCSFFEENTMEKY